MADLWDRFWEKVDRSGDCWTWTGSADSKGYGQIWDASVGKHRIASRVSWELTRGEIPDGASVLHKCDNPSCVRPTHLFVGDQLANMQDAVVKGRLKERRRPQSGEHHWRSSLTDQQVIELRKRYNDGEPRKKLAIDYGIKVPSVWRIATGRSR